MPTLDMRNLSQSTRSLNLLQNKFFDDTILRCKSCHGHTHQMLSTLTLMFVIGLITSHDDVTCKTDLKNLCKIKKGSMGH